MQAEQCPTRETKSCRLTSASFDADQPIPEEFAFGAPDPVLHVRLTTNHNPQLKWSGAPAQTRSYAVICVDTDVPTKPDDVNKEGRVVPARPAARQVLSLGDGGHSGNRD